MKRIATLLITLIMLFSITVAFAANTRTSGNYIYEIKGNGTITITDYIWNNVEFDIEELFDNGFSYDIFIPNMLDGYTVTSIGERAFYMDENEYAYINDSTMYCLINLNVTLNENIKSIGNEAFRNCCLFSINIPNSVQQIGYGAFVNHGGIDPQIRLSSSHPYFAIIDGCLYNKANKELIKGKSLGYDDKELIIPEGIRTIGEYAFSFCGIHQSIMFPSTLKELAPHAFEDSYIGAGDVQNVKLNFPESLEKIGDYAFYDATIDRIANMPISHTKVSYIGDYAFAEVRYEDYHHKTHYSLPSTLTILGTHAFENMHLKEQDTYEAKIMIPADCLITTISEYTFNAFDGELLLENPSAIKEIGEYAGCGNSFDDISDFSPELTIIPTGMNPSINELPNTITEIAPEAFSRVVENFRLPSSLTKIAFDAFPRYSSFIVEAGSYAELWCSENGFAYTVEGGNNLDWLNN